MSEFDHEPHPGLPELLPTGETLLWQGSPDWIALARRSLHVSAASIYIGAFAALSFASALGEGRSVGEAAAPALRILAVGATGIVLLALIAILIARTTIYTITSKRVVMRFGIALPMAVNLPYSRIAAADAKLQADGTAEIALRTSGNPRLGFVPLWPHVRAWRLKNPEPALRCLPDGRHVAQLLANAIAAERGTIAKDVTRPSIDEGRRHPIATDRPATANA